jgi:hypothetical protein
MIHKNAWLYIAAFTAMVGYMYQWMLHLITLSQRIGWRAALANWGIVMLMVSHRE